MKTFKFFFWNEPKKYESKITDGHIVWYEVEDTTSIEDVMNKESFKEWQRKYNNFIIE